MRSGLSREKAAALAALLNHSLTFVAPVDLSGRMLAELCSQIDPELVPVISAAAAILQDSVKPHVFLGGEQHLLDWPQLDGKVGDILTLLNDEEQAAGLIAPPADRNESVLLGEDLEPQIPRHVHRERPVSGGRRPVGLHCPDRPPPGCPSRS